MRLKMMLIVYVLMLSNVMSICPNNCSGHGKCENSVCVCYSDSASGENYVGSDCSLRGCGLGNPFSAVGSVYGSNSKVYGVAPSRRELSSVTEMNIAKRELSDVFTLELEKDSKALDAADGETKGRLWKVEGIKELVEPFGASGGIISCKFTKSDNTVEEKQLNVISRTSTSIYVLFDEEVEKIETGGTYESVVCSDILSMRNDLTQFNPMIKSVTTPSTGGRLLSNNNSTRKLQDGGNPQPPAPTEPPTLSLTWNGFFPILKDMGLLKPKTVVEGEGEVYEDLTFACYTPPSTGSITDVPLTIYTTNKVVKESGKDNNVQFTITESKLTAGTNYVCILAMNEDGSELKLEESDISEYIRKGKDANENDIYLIGKYATADDAKIENVIVGSVTTVTGTEITLTPPTDPDDKLTYGVNRIVYGTVLEDGIFKEVEVKITELTDQNIIKGTSQHTGNGLLLPYLRSSAISPLTSPPKQFIADKGSELFYKAYYFAEDLLKSMKREGGILNCKYTAPTTRRERILTEDPVEVDVRGIIKNSKGVIIYSYINVITGSGVSFSTDGTLECSSIKSIRNDMTKYHELSELTLKKETSPPSVSRQLDAVYNVITWSGYGSIFTDMKFSVDNKVKFGCFKTDDNSKKIDTIELTVSYETSANPSNVKFTYTPDENTKEGNYLCFMKTKFDKQEVVLEESDIKDRIVNDEKSPNIYYYGEYIITDKTRYLEEGKSEVITLSDKSEIKLAESDPSTTPSKITISDYDKLDANTKKLIDELKEFSLKMLQINSKYKEVTVTCKISTTRILQTSSQKELSFTFTPEDGFNKDDIPFYVVYLKMSPTTTPDPSEIPTYTPTNEIRNIDINSYFYEVKNFLDDIKESLPLIGGTIECKINEKNEIGLIDVRGVFDDRIYIKLENPLSMRRRILSSDEISLENIRDCRILNIRKDMSLYNVLKLDGSNYVNGIISWIGYGEIFPSLKGNIVCYTPSDEQNKEMKVYSNIEIYRMKNNNNNGLNDLRIRFGKDNKPSNGDICYMLSDSNGGNVISIKESELSGILSEVGDKYYFGSYGIDKDSGVSEEKKKSDGSVEISFDSNKYLKEYTDDVTVRFKEDNKDKIDLFDIKDPSSPSLYVPTDMIGIESEKMIIIGNTVELLIIDKSSGQRWTGNAQILKIEKDQIGRYKISLSNRIVLPTFSSGRRLRSLDTISNDLLIKLNWKSEGSTHVALECSGQGICDRESGLCKCFDGYSGSACQRLDCPNNCNGNGRCVALSELLSNDELEKYIGFGNKHVGDYKPDDNNNNNEKVQFDNQVYGCLCDKRHRGYDCSLIECPSGEDPEKATNVKDEDDEKRDCSGRGICNYSTGICECFDGFSGEGCQNQVETM